MRKIAVVGLSKKIGIFEFIKNIKKYETQYNFETEEFIYSNKEFNLYDVLSPVNFNPNDYFAAISVGGDGTFLYTSRVFAGTEIPVLGVNIGQLGFNTNIELKDFDYYFENFLNNKVEFDYKSMLDVQIEGDDKIYNVLNEGVISHTGISRMIRLKVDLEGHCIYDFRGDGLIISSPTGSTAYNLSAGGPILHPDVDAFSLCPICPHTLAIRPFIIPFCEKLIISILESSTQPQITLDGQKIILLDIGQKIVFKKSTKKTKTIKSDKNFYEILKLKLGWLG
ncbi:MAG TPA: NAD(+)/NADH kinase [Spirochaetota bacterium]|nr:NAD(+)/NADH kinase [Spirochaetota bacterium]